MFRTTSLLIALLALASALPTAAQRVSGTVRAAADGEPLIGVTVKVKDGPAAAVTDLDGHYSIAAAPKARLLFSYIGYTTKEESVGGRQTVDVALEEDKKTLDEVVVIGYGTMDKKELTSAISHVGEGDFLSVSSADPSMMIQGKVPGVSITNTGAGDPNNNASIQIRGVSSRSAGLGPLIVIDGVPGGSLNNLNANDIASFDILKDGAASAIYGTRGSNGVILVTTKKGTKDGAVHASYTASLTWTAALKELDMMSASDYRSQRLASGGTGADLGGNYDWLGGVTRTGLTHQHTLSLSGGTAAGNYRVSCDYRNAEGIDLRSGREEYGARASVQQTTKGGLLTLAANVAPRIIHRKTADWGVFKDALEANPTTPLMDPDAPERYYNFQGQVVASNPVERLRLETDGGDTKLLDWDASAKLNLLPLLARGSSSPLSLNTQISFADHSYDTTDKFHRPSTSTLCLNAGTEGEASQKLAKESQQILEWVTNFTAALGRHTIKAMAGYSYQYSKYEGFSAENKDFPNDGLGADNLGSGTYMKDEGQVGIESYKNDARLISFFGRVSYDWAGRYMFTSSLRHEGSSKFGADHKWGNFPAVSAGWRLSEERFMKSLTWIDDLKLRADFGVTGNQDFDSYQSINTMSGFGYYMYGGKYLQVWGPGKNVNPDLHWERGKNFNIGLDFSLFGGRLSGTVNYFNRHQQDLLDNYKVSVPPYLHDETFVNVGTMSNTGVEIELDALVAKTKDFSYNASFVGTVMSNKFADFSNSEFLGQEYYSLCDTTDPYPFYSLQRIQKGQPVGNFYMWRYAGLTDDGQWLVYDRAGQAITADKATDEDRTVVGNGMPKFTLSSTHTFRYRQFDLSLFFRGAFGFDIFNIHDFYYGTRNFTGNQLKKAYTDNAKISAGANPIVCDYFIEPGDYLKLDQLTLGYTLGLSRCRFIDRVRLSATVKNLLTITSFSGVDPSSYQVNGLTPGAQGTRDYYPSTRQIIVSAQIDF